MASKKIVFRDAQEALSLFGQNDQNLRSLESTYGVQIFGRGLEFTLRGSTSKLEKALAALEVMRSQNPAPGSDESLLSHAYGEAAYTTILGKAIHPRTPGQREYIDAIQKHDVVIGVGPAGTGKTYLAAAAALAALKAGLVSRVVLTRPVVEAGEKLGYLPGDLYEKVNPYLKPLYDAFHFMLGSDRFRLYREDETIEIVPLAYMRGRTLEKAFIILDEAQNATYEQIKMFMTRIGMGSKVIVNGDVTQIDLPRKSMSGLVPLMKLVQPISEIALVEFSEKDVVRHPLVKQLIRAYAVWEAKNGDNRS